MTNDLDFMPQDYDPKAAVEANGGDIDSPVPPGKYTAMITEAEVQDTKKGDGKMVFFRLDITGPKYAGRVVFDRIIVAHPSEVAVEIGQARFGAACLAAGFEKRPSDTKLFIGKTVGAQLKIEKSKEYGDSNRVANYFKPKGVSADSGAEAAFDQSFNDDDIPF